MRTEPSIITVCRDNPADLRATLRSVALQSRAPARHIVVDGSNETHRDEIERFCLDLGVEYHWAPPRGIYAAMAAGLELLDDDDWVWFLNATDVLAHRKSIDAVSSALAKESTHPNRTWLAGKTVVLWRGSPYEMPFAHNAAEYAFLLRRGLIGLAHPSTLMKVSALRKINPFAASAEVSEDYRIGIEMLKRGNYPALISSTLSIYDQSGFSAQFPVQTLWSKTKTRISTFGPGTIVFEPVPVFVSALRFLLRQMANLLRVNGGLLATGLKRASNIRPADEHFCGASSPRWPKCCFDYLYAE